MPARPKTEKKCYHGLTDDCRLTKKAVTEDYLRGKRATLYFYSCPTHGLEGFFQAEVAIPPGAR